MEDHVMDCSFRAPLTKIDLYAGGQHEADVKNSAALLPGLKPGGNFDLGQLPHHLSNR
jgi:hypothetical protein